MAARGFAMGSADVVPGVSGGTMAFILGIYEELIGSIRMLGRPTFLRPLLRGRLREASRAANIPFLAAVVAGIALAILTFARLLEWLLEDQPVFVWSFFFGLVVASIVVVARRIKKWNGLLVVACGLGALGAYFLVGAVPLRTPETWWFIVLSGAVAICAMILPGISGAFMLVLLGKYQFILAAVNERDIGVIALFAIGALTGIVSFAQLLGWLFRRHHDLTVAVLIGLMAGSLRKIWPWKEVVDFITNSAGNIIPTHEINTAPPLFVDGAFNLQVLWALLLVLAGLLLVLALDWAQRRRERRLAATAIDASAADTPAG